jgi:putative flippase GtrA
MSSESDGTLSPVVDGRSFFERGWRYTSVALFIAVANNVVMIAIDMLGGHYLLGTAAALVLMTPVAYVLHSWFTFGEPFSLAAFGRFSSGVLAAYPLGLFLMVVLCSGLRLPVIVAAPIATVALFAWNFLAAHWSILRRFNFVEGKVGSATEH